jgi:hypothetical protein
MLGSSGQPQPAFKLNIPISGLAKHAKPRKKLLQSTPSPSTTELPDPFYDNSKPALSLQTRQTRICVAVFFFFVITLFAIFLFYQANQRNEMITQANVLL